MIFYWEGRAFPVEFKPGDVVFATGRSPTSAGGQPPFEHVALVAEARLVRDADELSTLDTYGLPESATALVGLQRSKAVNLRRRGSRSWGEIGSVASLWNLAGREETQTDRGVDQMIDFLEVQTGRYTFQYDDTGSFDDDAFTRGNRVMASCMGFVCSVLKHQSAHVLHRDFPPYPSPYRIDRNKRTHRNYPSPGHLAYALRMGPGCYPYQAQNEREAAHYACASRVLAEVGGSGAPPAAGLGAPPATGPGQVVAGVAAAAEAFFDKPPGDALRVQMTSVRPRWFTRQFNHLRRAFKGVSKFFQGVLTRKRRGAGRI